MSDQRETYTVSSKFRDVYADREDVVVYGLICPLTGEIFYIGKTTNPQGRLENHASQNPYYQELAQHELEYTFKLVVIERWPSQEYHPTRETYWILKTLESGVELKNKAFPTTLTPQWVNWLDAICEMHGWINRKTTNNRVRELPEYEVPS